LISISVTSLSCGLIKNAFMNLPLEYVYHTHSKGFLINLLMLYLIQERKIKR
jgi:hypothetical protein